MDGAELWRENLNFLNPKILTSSQTQIKLKFMFKPYRALALLPLLMFARPLCAQPLPDRVPINGVVTGVRGAPIAGVLLSIWRSNPNQSVAFWGATAQSNDDGSFAIPDAEEGDYVLRAQAPGYADLTNLPIQWRSGDAPIKITLDRLLDFTLDLRAPDGSPVANAPVYLRLRPSDINGQKNLNVRADEQGAVAVTGIKPDKYGLYLRAPQGYASLFDVDVVEPQTPPLTVQLQKAGALKLTVSDDLGRALGGANLSLSPATAEESQRLNGVKVGPADDFALLAAGNNRNDLVSRDGDGTLELDGLPPGVYAPGLFLPGYHFDTPEPITIVAGQTLDLKFKAPTRRARTLNLQLRTPDDKPYTAGEVSLRILPIAANGQLGGDPAPNPDDADDLPFFPSGPGGRRVLPDAQGKVALFPVKAGRYRIFASPRIQDATRNAPEATPVDVTITATGATATVIVPKS